jgi:hypothetical protein
MGSFAPLLLKACVAAAQHVKEEDFMFTVEAAGFGWDVYRVVLDDQVGQIAFRLTEDKQVCFGWLGPRERPPADIQHIIEHGLFNQDIPDA